MNLNRRTSNRRSLSNAVVLIFLSFILLLGAIFATVTGITASNSGNDIYQTNDILENTNQSERQNPPTYNSEDWMLTLVNPDNPLPNNYSPELKSLNNGLQFDERAIDQLNAMLCATQAQGLSPVVCSAYRSTEKQTMLFSDMVSSFMAKGIDSVEADIEARKVVAYPGTSEHNLGLAADIVSSNYQLLDEAQEDTPESKWLIKHCFKYGFILRYPKGKSNIAGIIYEPWHFRYIGVDAAK